MRFLSSITIRASLIIRTVLLALDELRFATAWVEHNHGATATPSNGRKLLSNAQEFAGRERALISGAGAVGRPITLGLAERIFGNHGRIETT